MARGMTIGRLAKAAAVHVETIRYYQRVGLIEEPRKPAGGHRSYPPETLDRLGFIRRAQELGFTLADIRELGTRVGKGDTDGVRKIAQARHEKLVLQVVQLTAMSGRLKALLDQSRDAGDADPVSSALNGHAGNPGDAKAVL